MADSRLDEYTLKARVFPAFIVLLPLGILLGQFTSTKSVLVGACSGFGGSALIGFLLAQWSRDFGKRREKDLWIKWGAAPTTLYLRHAEPCENRILKERRLRRLGDIRPEFHLPTEDFEKNDLKAADMHYDAVTKYLISQTRDQKKFSILFQENIAYGFRRNLWALKPFGTVCCSISLLGGVALAFMGQNQSYNLLVSTLSALMLLLWVLAIDMSWVRRAGVAYADRLFAYLDGV
jgi:hypothetical protein